jgi:hypothetical protein
VRNGANQCADSVRKIAWAPLRTLIRRETRFCTPYKRRLVHMGYIVRPE